MSLDYLFLHIQKVTVHTKFIKENIAVIYELFDILLLEHLNTDHKEFEKRFYLKFRESLIRFKILDKEISLKYFSGIDDMLFL